MPLGNVMCRSVYSTVEARMCMYTGLIGRVQVVPAAVLAQPVCSGGCSRCPWWDCAVCAEAVLPRLHSQWCPGEADEI